MTMTVAPAHGQGEGESGFWARQTPKDKIIIAAFVVELLASVGLLLVGVLVANLSIAGRMALLTGNIVLLVTTLQFAVSRFFDDQGDEIRKLGGELEDVKNRMSQTLEEVESITMLSGTYTK